MLVKKSGIVRRIEDMIKSLVKKLIYREKADSNSYVKHLRKIGVRIGDRTIIYSPTKSCIDTTRPWLLEIGDDVKITEGVTILTHGYDWCVLQKKYNEVLGSAGKVKIGNNVFIGMKTTILKNVEIGDNVIIGANSLVNKNIPSDVVVAGNPARIVMSIEEYYQKRKEVQEIEARGLIQEYRKVYNRDPEERDLHEFFWLFSDGRDKIPQCWERMLYLDGEGDCAKKFETNEKKYENIGEFFKSVRED